MASISEYEQQQFWDKPNLTSGISGTTFKLIIKDNWFKSSIFDDLLYGESYTHITKDCVRRIHPLSEEAESIKNKLTNGK